ALDAVDGRGPRQAGARAQRRAAHELEAAARLGALALRVAADLATSEPEQEWVDVGGVAVEALLRAREERRARAAERVEKRRLGTGARPEQSLNEPHRVSWRQS